MRKNNGFTLIELLAVIIILALLIVLVIPSYAAIYSSIRRQNYQSKIVEINAAAQKYGSKIKDEIKNKSCVTVSIETLISEGLIISEEDSRAVIHDPTTNKPLEGSVEVCYCKSSFDIQSFYAEDFKSNTIYHKGDYVRYNNVTYEVIANTKKGKNGIAKIGDSDSNKYFEKLGC